MIGWWLIIAVPSAIGLFAILLRDAASDRPFQITDTAAWFIIWLVVTLIAALVYCAV